MSARYSWLTICLVGLLAGCVTRESSPPVVSRPISPCPAPRVYLVTCTVESFDWYADLTSWVHSQELLDTAFAEWLQVPAARRVALNDPDRHQLRRFFTEELPAKLGPDDILIVYLGTHQLKNGHLLLANGTYLQAADLQQWLGALPSTRNVLLADVCYADRMEQDADFDERLVRLYAARGAEEAPEIPLDFSLRPANRFFAATQASIQHELGLSHDHYSLLGLMTVHALRLELMATPTELSLDRLAKRMETELATFATTIRQIAIPHFAMVNVQPWVLGEYVAGPLVTAGEQSRPKSLEALLSQPDSQIDVGLGNLLIGHVYDSSVDVDKHLATLDAMADTLRQRLGDERRPEKVIAIINHYLYDEEKFEAQEAPYTTDFLLHELLATHKGRCSALVSLYLALGHRLGIPLHSRCIPEHIYVRWDRQPNSTWDWPAKSQAINIETTLRGIRMEDDQYSIMHNWQMTPKGKQFYQKSLTAKQTIGTLYSPLASALLKQGLTEESVQASRRSIEINPCDAEAWNNLGMARRQQNKDNLAIACYRTALEIHPHFAEVWNNLGTLQPDAKSRVRYYQQAVQIKPNLGEAWKNLAYAMFDLGDFKQARECVNRCEALHYPVATRFLELLKRREQP